MIISNINFTDQEPKFWVRFPRFLFLIFAKGKISLATSEMLDWRPGLTQRLKPGLHIVVVMVVSTVANMFLALFQTVLIHVNTLITTLQA